MIIYCVNREYSYGDFGETDVISYHQTKQGATNLMDKEATGTGFVKVLTSNGDYYYKNSNGYYLSVESIKLED